MKSLDIEKILKEIISTDKRSSDDIKKLTSYNSFINNISENCSNDELESLSYLLEEIGKNIRYDIFRSRTIKEYSIIIENDKFDRKNHIKIKVYCHNLLKLSNRDRYISRDSIHKEDATIQYYKNKYDTISPIYEKLDEIYTKYKIRNKIEVESKVAEYTGMKRQ